MGKLKVFTGKKVCALLAKNDFENIRQRGSHVVMQKKIGLSTVTVVVPMHSEIRAGTLSSIIRQSKLPCKHFEV